MDNHLRSCLLHLIISSSSAWRHHALHGTAAARCHAQQVHRVAHWSPPPVSAQVFAEQAAVSLTDVTQCRSQMSSPWRTWRGSCAQTSLLLPHPSCARFASCCITTLHRVLIIGDCAAAGTGLSVPGQSGRCGTGQCRGSDCSGGEGQELHDSVRRQEVETEPLSFVFLATEPLPAVYTHTQRSMAQRAHPYSRTGTETLDPLAKTRLEISALLGDNSFSGPCSNHMILPAASLPPSLPASPFHQPSKSSSSHSRTYFVFFF